MTTPVQNFTYAQLLALIPSYLERKDTAMLDQLPTFISLAENRLAADLKQQGFQSVVKGTLPLTVSMPKPAFWRETISFSYTDANNTPQPILLRNLEVCKAYAASQPTDAAPRFYADYNATNFYLTPAPTIPLPFELVYYARLQPLSDDNQSNWMTLNMPQALLYAALMEAQLWLKNWQVASAWEAQYNTAKGYLASENQERLADRNVIVTRG